MSKKWIITLSIVFSAIAVLLILFWTLFGLSTVTVSFDSTLKNLNLSKNEIVAVGNFKKHASVLFEGKKKYINKIYDYAKENPEFAYIKISNIETIFPNKFVIHITEREELFAVENNGQVLICDRELRVLRIEDEYQSEQDNALLLKNLTIRNEEIQVGDFLNVEEKSIKNFYSANLKNNKNLSQILGKYKQMSIFSYADEITNVEYKAIELTSFSNQKYQILNIDFALPEKFQLLYAVESAMFSEVDEFGFVLNNGQRILVKQNEAGEYITDNEGEPLSLEMLFQCTIKIDNLTITSYTPRTEKDLYYSFIKN